MSQSMYWEENVIFAMAPLGIITAIVSAIRVGGPTWMKAVIGRAREGKGVAEIELMSSTSHDVTELWKGDGIVRVLGSSPIIELFYREPTDNGSTSQTEGDKLLSNGETAICDPSGIYDFETAKTAGVLSNDKTPSPESEDGHHNQVAPNIALTISGRKVSRLETRLIAVVGTLLQLAVIIFAGFGVLYSPWNERFGKDNEPVQPYAFPLLCVGTATLVLGMFLCSHIVERSTTETTWNIEEPKEGQVKVAWLQKGGSVSDQHFDSYLIQREEKASNSRQSLNADLSHKIFTSHRGKEKQLATLTCILQFFALRGLNWSATIAQLLATAVMTFLRAVIRRKMVYDIKPELIARGYELDMAAKKITGCGLID
ncbi:hypothetical protein BZA05DRAFT_354781 [Tricharina praecox]|uniref:uncharacterized protein n=1 Tax=Tricharina praecox TaxID=43433 RepID=UPI00221EB9CD|nr:uncharacterized protein BZA05DRAFT_354781 [Tricharina praecox]KAI5849720.1 hypothetical protein BZA05DRAFT_354781 [Tricharina praecox]